MTDLRAYSASGPAQRVLPAARPERRAVRHAPATAVGLLTAVALGAGVLLLPGGGPSAADQLTTVTLVHRPAHPAPPVVPVVPVAPVTAPQAPAAPVAQFRDPFRPLVSDEGQSVPAAAPDTSDGAPVVEAPVDAPAPTFELPQAPPVALPPPPDTSAGSPSVPSVPSSPSSPSSGAASLAGRKLSLTAVEAAGDGFVAVMSLDGTALRAEVGASFGPAGELLLLSLQQGPADGQWTAVVQRGRGEPFDVVTGTPKRLP